MVSQGCNKFEGFRKFLFKNKNPVFVQIVRKVLKEFMGCCSDEFR